MQVPCFISPFQLSDCKIYCSNFFHSIEPFFYIYIAFILKLDGAAPVLSHFCFQAISRPSCDLSQYSSTAYVRKKKIMAYVRRRFRRLRRMSTRSRCRRVSLYRRTRRRAVRRVRRGSRSAAVRIRIPLNWVPVQNNVITPFFFNSNVLTALRDYSGAYSQWRILSARLKMFRGETVQTCDCTNTGGETEHNCQIVMRHGWAVASSKQLFRGYAYTDASNKGWSTFLPGQSLADLRQCKYYRETFPNTTRLYASFAFKPWWICGGTGPDLTMSGGGTTLQYAQARACSRWMSMDLSLQYPVPLFGPYICPLTPEQSQYQSYSSPNPAFSCELCLTVQFKGQR